MPIYANIDPLLSHAKAVHFRSLFILQFPPGFQWLILVSDHLLHSRQPRLCPPFLFLILCTILFSQALLAAVRSRQMSQVL